eukprot:s3455_g11.t1
MGTEGEGRSKTWQGRRSRKGERSRDCGQRHCASRRCPTSALRGAGLTSHEEKSESGAGGGWIRLHFLRFRMPETLD